MKYGVTFPELDPRELLDLGLEAEWAGWDGVFTEKTRSDRWSMQRV